MVKEVVEAAIEFFSGESRDHFFFADNIAYS